MARTAIVGDVHGMREALARLLEELRLEAGDRLILVGDLIDKGPDPAGVVQDLARLKQSAPFEIVLVEGNHEDKHRRYRRNLDLRPAVAGRQAEAAPELPALTAQLTEAGRAFLASAVPFHRLPELGILVLHGGVPGNMRRFPQSVEAAGALTGKARDQFSLVLRTRYIDQHTGGFLGLDQEQPGDPFWAAVYDGRFGHIVFGHQPFPGKPAEFRHATGIDTGAVHGGGLTAMVLDPDGQRRFVHVPTQACSPMRKPAPPVS